MISPQKIKLIEISLNVRCGISEEMILIFSPCFFIVNKATEKGNYSKFNPGVEGFSSQSPSITPRDYRRESNRDDKGREQKWKQLITRVKSRDPRN